jgi:hypothetical protein
MRCGGKSKTVFYANETHRNEKDKTNFSTDSHFLNALPQYKLSYHMHSNMRAKKRRIKPF